ncbi:diaminopimelate epimerase [Dethiothermospora halolimnae]|uniref:diaminopimelate epimerase n=1 Tax=Dethiothermospora halolimnae TaxID=3114390 RepID=UPI003CCC3B71
MGVLHLLYFEKFHGAGNDFIILNGLEEKLLSLPVLAKDICDRHFGIGADGMIVVESSKIADIKMTFFNSDGSRAPMCGNGIRCFGKYVYDNKIVDKEVFDVETLAGIIKLEVIPSDKGIEGIRVNIGEPIFDNNKFPINTEKSIVIEESIEVNNQEFKISALFIGTIHAVIFVANLDEIDINTIGPCIENNSMFPEKTNINFCEVIDNKNLKVITWERGAGLTLACGTGAAATAVISSIVNKTDNNVNVYVPGGLLKIEKTEAGVYMTGPAELICKGNYNYTNLRSDEDEKC